MIGALTSTWSAVAVMIVKKHATTAAATIAKTILYAEYDTMASLKTFHHCNGSRNAG